MSKLTKYKFSDLYEMSSGISSSKEQAGHGSPFISFSTVFNNYFLPEELPDLMDTSLKEQEIFSVKKDDVFITRTSETVDALAMSCVAVKDYPKATFSGFVKRLRPKTTGIVYSKYIAFFLRSKYFRKVLDCNTIMTLRASFNEDMFSFLHLYLPDYEEQVRIGDLLYKMEMKIRTNNKINDNLEQQAAALFSSLYNRSNTEVRYTDLIQILGGGTPKTGETAYWNGNIAFFTPKDVGAPYTFITEKTITEEGLSHCNSRLYPVNTVFVTARGTVGKVGLSGVPMAMNQSCYALVGKETHQLLVYFYTLKAVDRLKHKASGAVFDAITTRDFDSEQIMKLSDDDAKAFLCVAEPMFQEILNNSIENLRLSTLRDFLLPKLMSGEIDVSSVQI